eukprot:jgi/Picsp_1/4104/NSC_01614-R1_extracellular metalloprotease
MASQQDTALCFSLLTFVLLLVPNSVNGKKSCTNALLRKLDPSYKYIDDVLHEWTEYKIEDGTICIAMELPEKKVLTEKEAEALIKKSESWFDQQDVPINGSTEGTTITPDENVIADPFAYHVLESDLEYGIDFNGASSDATISNMTGMGPWHAYNGSADKSEFAIVTQNILGTDDRKIVGDTTAFPSNTISYYQFSHPDISSGNGRCTAFAVNKYMALTNSHCVYKNGKYITRGSSTFIAPGQKGSAQPYGRFYVCNGRASVPWVSRSECHSGRSMPGECVGYDYAVIRVSRPMSSIKTYMPILFDYNPARGTTLNTAGYPAVAQGQKTMSQYWTSGQVYQAPGGDRALRHKMDSSNGQSGSPIWRYRTNAAKSRQIIAIHASGSDDTPFNSGARFVSANFEAIKSMLENVSC